MSREELLNEFMAGRISRRSLVRRLVAGGVSIGAAVSYAQMISPERAVAGAVGDDHYPLVVMTLRAMSLANVISHNRVLVDLTTSEEIAFISLRAFLKDGANGLRVIGTKNKANPASGPSSFTLTVPVAGAALQGKSSATIWVWGTGNDAEEYPALATAKRTFT
jgi:hypothetical protein